MTNCCLALNENDVVLVTPSDHFIEDQKIKELMFVRRNENDVR